MKAKVYSKEGKEVREIELDDRVFSVEASEGSIYHAIKNELANRRQGTACTRGRGQVRGSTAKPWRQKGTGRARAGDKKAPQWVGGGTVFGPLPKDYSYQLPKKIKRFAMRSLLTIKARGEVSAFKVIEDFTIESGRTKDFVAVLKNLTDLSRKEKTVVLLGGEDPVLRRAGRNLPNVRFLSHNRLSAHQLYYSKHVLVLEGALEKLSEIYGGQ